jgi:hypothetical protein
MLDDAELAEIQKAARRQRMTTAEWVRQTLREDRQTSETALLFLQLIMRKLRRRPTPERLSRDLTTRFSGG